MYRFASKKIEEMEITLLYKNELIFQRLITLMCNNGLKFSREKAKVKFHKIVKYKFKVNDEQPRRE